MAALLVALVGCNKETHQVTPVDDGQAAFIQVDIKAAGTLTKATPGTYEYGSDDENAVKTINFYFFDAAGNPYSVVNTGENTISWTRSGGTTAGNIEEISDVVLVIKQSEAAPPAKVVAILNDTRDFSNKSLSELTSEVVSALHTNKTNFVMSNSVYLDENRNAVMVASEIKEENIFTLTQDNSEYEVGDVISADEVTALKINPIDIYVERVAAKVKVGALSSSTDKTLSSLIPVMSGTDATQLKDSGNNPVYAKILGWDVTNATDEAYLIKNIENTWTIDALGFSWNDAAHFRSYWAKTTATPAHTRTFEHLMTRSNVTEDYYFENTHATKHSQLLVAAQLVALDGTNEVPINLAKWYNVLYTIGELKTAMINTVATKLYIQQSTVVEGGTTTTTYRTIGVDDVVFYQMPSTTESKRYEVKVKAKTEADVVYYAPTGGTDEHGNPVMEVCTNPNEILGAIEPAQMWNEGHAYYYLNIKHFGSPDKPGEFGIVRNHVYDIKINVDQLLGFGTPVYDENEVIIPEKTEDQEALNLAAQINILSWHLVSQEVTLQ